MVGNTWRRRRATASGARRPSVVLTLLIILALAGCAGMAEQAQSTDFCQQYEELVVAADEFRDQDLVSADGDDLRAQVERLHAGLDQVQAVAEGQLDNAAAELQAELDELAQVAVDAGEQAREAAQPLAEESVEEFQQKWVALRDAADAQCGG